MNSIPSKQMANRGKKDILESIENLHFSGLFIYIYINRGRERSTRKCSGVLQSKNTPFRTTNNETRELRSEINDVAFLSSY